MDRKHSELIVREGWPFIVPCLILFGVSLGLSWPWWLSLIIGLLLAFNLNFFRNPYRQIPQGPGLIVSPGDGKVVSIRDSEDGDKCISIFLNVFNVHVNRSPIEGMVTHVEHKKGAFLNAANPRASVENEMNIVDIKQGNFEIRVIQIAGLIARRIICWVGVDEVLKRGQRFGLIRFGSRVDIFFDPSCEICVKVGQKVKGGRDILAKWEKEQAHGES